MKSTYIQVLIKNNAELNRFWFGFESRGSDLFYVLHVQNVTKYSGGMKFL